MQPNALPVSGATPSDLATPRDAMMTRRVLCATAFLAFLAYEAARTPLTSLYAHSLGAGESLTGWIVAASTLTGVLLRFPSGILADVVGRRRTLLLGCSLFAFVPLAYAFAAAPATLFAVRLLHGAAAAFYSPAAIALIVASSPLQRAEAIGWYSAAGLAGRSAGALAIGYVLVLLGQSYRWTFVATAPLGIAALLLASTLRIPGPPASRAAGPAMRAAVRAALGDRRVLLTGAAVAAPWIATGALQAFLPIYAQTVCGVPAPRIGWLYGVHLIASLLMRPAMGRVADRAGRAHLIAAGMLVSAASFVWMPHTRSFPLLLLLSAIYGFAEALFAVAASAHVADEVPGERLAASLGIYVALLDVGHATGPVLAGWLLAATGSYEVMHTAIAGLVVAAAGLFLASERRYEAAAAARGP